MHGGYQSWDVDTSNLNQLQHTHALPDFFWDSQKTDMNCLRYDWMMQTKVMGLFADGSAIALKPYAALQII